MSLRRQLFLVSLFTLALPWAGWEYVKTIERSLLEREQAVVQAKAGAHAAHLATLGLWQDERVLAPFKQVNDHALYAHPHGQPLVLDGYLDEGKQAWIALYPADAQSHQSIFKGSLQAKRQGQSLYLFLKIRDKTRDYYSPYRELDQVDRLSLSLSTGDEFVEYVLTTSAPGPITVRQGERVSTLAPISGFWVDTLNGYQIELRIDLPTVTDYRIKLTVYDGGENALRLSDTLDGSVLISRQQAFMDFFRSNTQSGDAMGGQGILNPSGWIIAQSDSQGVSESSNNPYQTFGTRVLRWLLGSFDFQSLPEAGTGKLLGEDVAQAQGGKLGFAWYLDGRQLVARAAVPVALPQQARAIYVFEQRFASVDTLVSSAISELVLYSLFAAIVAVGGLLAYASILSWRIRALRQAADQAVDDNGRMIGAFHASNKRDEIGDVSRSFAALLNRQKQHQQYLETLASKLSHELKTPLAIVRSSLDNLDDPDMGAAGKPYIQRAQSGVSRLSGILSAMVEASRIEQSIFASEKSEFELTELIKEVASAYRQVYQQQIADILVQVPDGSVAVLGSADLIAQLLDKLISNAVDFCLPGCPIRIALEVNDAGALLSVSNHGAPIESSFMSQMFDPLVSQRTEPKVQIDAQQTNQEEAQDAGHLGLGLYIVRLIAEWHGGQARAYQTDDGDGQRWTHFAVTLPFRLVGRV